MIGITGGMNGDGRAMSLAGRKSSRFRNNQPLFRCAFREIIWARSNETGLQFELGRLEEGVALFFERESLRRGR
jgi:hypothetical protein